MKISGDIVIGEGTPWAGKACRRLQSRISPWLLLGVAIATIFAFGMLTSLAADNGWIPSIFLPVLIISFSVCVLFAYVRVQRTVSVRAFTKALTVRGVTNPLPSSFSIEDDALTYDIGQVSTRVSWRVVSEIFRAGPYWIVLAQGAAHFLPVRYFETPAQEAAFLAAMLARMSPEARARSDEAARAAD